MKKLVIYLALLVALFINAALFYYFILGNYSETLDIKDNINPIYIATKRGLTVVDSKTDSIVTEGFNPNYSDDLTAFYKTKLFTSFSGTDFPINVRPNTNIFDLKTGDGKRISDDTLTFLKTKNDFVYGLGYEHGLIFIYDAKKKKFNEVDPEGEPIFPTFIGFVELKDKQNAIVLSDNSSLAFRSLDGKKVLSRKKVSHAHALIADNKKVVIINNADVKVLDLNTNKIRNLSIGPLGDVTVFYAAGRLYVGESSSTSDKAKATIYKVYRLSDGEVEKELSMDLRDYNVIKINDSLVFLEGPQKGFALNLSTAVLEKTNIGEQSIAQDGKIYSAVKDRLIIRRNIGTAKTLNLDSNVEKMWDDDVSVYNRGIFSSEPTSDNFRIVDEMY